MTIFEKFLAESNEGWWLLSLESYNREIVPVGHYFVYQEKYGSPLQGGTQPIWSYDLSKILYLWNKFGGYVYTSDFEILKKP
jgi:hypothetical protein